MNTRRKLVQAKPAIPSTRWHLMNEAYKDIFASDAHAHVEDWYNLGATGRQRDTFRAICAEIYACDPNAPEPASRAAYTAAVEREEADLMIKYYTNTLTQLGKRKARTWIRQTYGSGDDKGRRRRDSFRDVFTGCQAVFEKKSVTHADYTAPDAAAYSGDSTHFHRSVDWTSLKARDEAQALQKQRTGESGEAPPSSSSAAAARSSGVMQRPSVVVANRERAMKGQTRVTKPKSQFDGVNNLASLGFPDDMPAEEAIATLRAKHEAFAKEKSYYVDKDGSTVYVAANVSGAARKTDSGRQGTVAGGGMLASVTSEPITQWKVKTVDY